VIYQKLAEVYGWTPGQVNELTLFQLAVFMGGITPEHGKVKMSPIEAQSYVRHLKEVG
jgi:hypothetical protein